MRRLILLFLTLLVMLCRNSFAGEPQKIGRTFTVRDGLPQSYISGLHQDRLGFIWISTLNGLARYDGREIKRFQHATTDQSGLSGNIILHMHQVGDNNIWLWYVDGKIDQFNTLTGKVINLWKKPNFQRLKGELLFRSLVKTSKNSSWMMANKGGLYHIDHLAQKTAYISPSALRLTSPILGIGNYRSHLLVLTKTKLLIYNDDNKLQKTLPYPFGKIDQFKNGSAIYTPFVRKNGELIICDANGLKVWSMANKNFTSIKLPKRAELGRLIASLDPSGNFYFEFERGIYILKADNSLEKWLKPSSVSKGIPTSMLIDRSGVLWAGTNGFGLNHFNLTKNGLPGFDNNYSFVYDVLSRYGIPMKELDRVLLSKTVSFSNRMATQHDSIWITDIYRASKKPQLMLAQGRSITVKTFHSVDAKNSEQYIKFLCPGNSGIIWGINQRYELVKFDTRKLTYELKGKIKIDSGAIINGMVEDGPENFYLSSDKGLYRFRVDGKRTDNLSHLLPTIDLLNLCKDPKNNNMLWIGSLSDGLFQLDKTNGAVQVFNTANGLPNNTVYGIMAGNDQQLWCSSNRGIFSFDPQRRAIRPFTSSDGLRDDEFNRYYFVQLPKGNLAFGGPMGFTIFDPSKLKVDNFNPQVRLTDLHIINYPIRHWSLGRLRKLVLNYDQNFITVVFSAMQFNIPEKIQYRYMLRGLDKNWMLLGNENKASYTSLPPGDYTLLINATNTAGIWSNSITSLQLTIRPPFWKTWWFITLVILLISLILYVILYYRIRNIKKNQQQIMEYEREAMELHALALRARMNPHFIFNCLNSIKALIQEKENTKAVAYLTTFATLIRKQLHNNSNEITLQEELETCRLYLNLEKMRFEDRISFVFEIEDDETLQQTKIPPLLIQPIIENAIVHGLLPSPNGGRIRIKLYRDEQYGICEVEDNGIGRAKAEANKLKSSQLHQSRGTHLLEERIMIYNKLNRDGSSLETIDLFTETGAAAGTLVIIKFKLEL